MAQYPISLQHFFDPVICIHILCHEAMIALGNTGSDHSLNAIPGLVIVCSIRVFKIVLCNIAKIWAINIALLANTTVAI